MSQLSLTAGTKLGHYEIVGLLGAGGMGEVYRARDPRLGRDVALKVLSSDVAGEPVRLKRFLREAQVVASLNHPHIVTIYSTEEAGGAPFITMELVEGRTLAALLQPEGMPLVTFLDVAAQIADALTAAHQKQITHRDLKPGNVMIDANDRVKVLDFGLARVVESEAAILSTAETEAMLTREGTVVGTVPYMSPEQVAGQQIDSRSDLFSLGVIFYEMLSGVRPFQNDSMALVISAILRDTPPALVELRADVPEALARLVSRCLEKRPEDRIQTARDVYNELLHIRRQLGAGRAESQPIEGITPALHVTDRTRQNVAERRSTSGEDVTGATLNIAHEKAPKWQRWLMISSAVAVLAALLIFRREDHVVPQVTATVIPKSVAVLPFRNISGQTGNDYLSDGITEEVMSALARVPELKVVSRTSAFAFENTRTDIRDIAAKLGVATVVEGSVRTNGTELRVVAQLVNAKDGYQLWSETYDRKVNDLFAIQDEIARAVAQALRVRLTGTTGSRTKDLQAYEAYLQGREASALWTAEGLQKAISYFRFAIDRDPSFSQAWAGMADAYSLMDHRSAASSLRPEESYRLAEEAARQALSLDPDSAEAHAALGHIFTHTGRFAEAEQHGRRAVELDPNSAVARTWYAVYLRVQRRFAESKQHLHRAREVDPYSRQVALIGTTLAWVGDYEGAVDASERGIQVSPQFGDLHVGLARAKALQGRFAEARAALARAENVTEPSANLAETRALVMALSGDRAGAIALLNTLERNGKRPPTHELMRAWAVAGELERAIQILNEIEIRTPFYTRANLSFPPHPAFRALLADPRYQETRRKLGLPRDDSRS